MEQCGAGEPCNKHGINNSEGAVPTAERIELQFAYMAGGHGGIRPAGGRTGSQFPYIYMESLFSGRIGTA